ncbi:hypothetical protein D3C80_1670460 [compost metagenome]
MITAREIAAASSMLRGRKVGLIRLPPLIRAAAATAVCKGVVAMPWPKEIVTELIFFHVLGWVGVATPGISVSILDRRPSRVRNS